MAQQVSDHFDRLPVTEENGGQEVADGMGAIMIRRHSSTEECLAYEPVHRCGSDRSRRGVVLEEEFPALCLRSGVAKIVEEGFGNHSDERQLEKPQGFWLADAQSALSSVDVLKGEIAELSRSQSGGRQDEEDGVVPFPQGRGTVDGLECMLDLFPGDGRR